MGTLGHKVFEPFVPSSEAEDAEPVLYLEYGKGRASGKRTSDGFVIFKGSAVNPSLTKSCPERTIKDRKSMPTKSTKMVSLFQISFYQARHLLPVLLGEHL